MELSNLSYLISWVLLGGVCSALAASFIFEHIPIALKRNFLIFIVTCIGAASGGLLGNSDKVKSSWQPMTEYYKQEAKFVDKLLKSKNENVVKFVGEVPSKKRANAIVGAMFAGIGHLEMKDLLVWQNIYSEILEHNPSVCSGAWYGKDNRGQILRTMRRLSPEQIGQWFKIGEKAVVLYAQKKGSEAPAERLVDSVLETISNKLSGPEQEKFKSGIANGEKVSTTHACFMIKTMLRESQNLKEMSRGPLLRRLSSI